MGRRTVLVEPYEDDLRRYVEKIAPYVAQGFCDWLGCCFAPGDHIYILDEDLTALAYGPKHSGVITLDGGKSHADDRKTEQIVIARLSKKDANDVDSSGEVPVRRTERRVTKESSAAELLDTYSSKGVHYGHQWEQTVKEAAKQAAIAVAQECLALYPAEAARFLAKRANDKGNSEAEMLADLLGGYETAIDQIKVWPTWLHTPLHKLTLNEVYGRQSGEAYSAGREIMAQKKKVAGLIADMRKEACAVLLLPEETAANFQTVNGTLFERMAKRLGKRQLALVVWTRRIRCAPMLKLDLINPIQKVINREYNKIQESMSEPISYIHVPKFVPDALREV